MKNKAHKVNSDGINEVEGPKHNEENNDVQEQLLKFPLRHKARLNVKRFSQKKSIAFDEIFAHVVEMSSICVVMGLETSIDLEVEQMDVKTAFLHEDLNKEIYMEQHERNEKICR